MFSTDASSHRKFAGLPVAVLRACCASSYRKSGQWSLRPDIGCAHFYKPCRFTASSVTGKNLVAPVMMSMFTLAAS